MSKRTDIEARAEALLLPIVEELQLELVDVEYVKEAGNFYLRAYIDKEGGVTIDDCETVSRAFNPKLDEADFIDDSYTMEISSPGLGRPLKKEKDYARSIGKELEIHTYKAVDGGKEFFGVLDAYDKDTVTITEEDGTQHIFQRAGISMIRLAFHF
ncbi:MAG: ribosome maturation factor RimP [Eubacterium sp.]|nr:ribosome maturation factor RimP [Eubacterium sp.]